MKLRRIMGAATIVVGSLLFMGGIASAHDVTPNEDSYCTSPTTGVVKFTATNMGSEQRDISVYLNGNLVGQLLDFTGNGTKSVGITIPAQPPGPVSFTWTTDAVSHPPSTIVIDWSPAKCQPEVTTIATTVPTTIATTVPTTIVTTIPTTIATTVPTTVATTVPQTTIATTTSVPCEVLHTCNITTVATTAPTTIASTTIATTVATTIPDTSAVDQTVPPAALVPATTVVPQLPHTGSSTGPEVALGLGLMAVGGLVLASSRRRAA